MSVNKNIILKAVNLCKTYATGTEQYHAIRNVTLEICQGDFTIIIGSSGSGKSTLLYLLSGLDNLSAGEVYFKEQRIDGYNEKKMSDFRTRNISFVYQGINLVPDLTIFENIALPGYLSGAAKSIVKKKALSLMESMDILSLKNRLPSQVSGGQQQRAAIARALINSPDILFADEPTGSLNQEYGTSVLDAFTQLNSNGQTVIMVTHDIKAACRADRIIMIRDGKVDGMLELDKYRPEDTLSREKTIFSYLSRKE